MSLQRAIQRWRKSHKVQVDRYAEFSKDGAAAKKRKKRRNREHKPQIQVTRRLRQGGSRW